MTHESLSRHEQLEGPSNRSVGLLFAGFFAIIGLLPLLWGEPARLWALSVAVAFLVVALAFAAALTPLNILWMKLGALLHRIVNPVVLGFMFFLVVTPTGLLMRLLGKDPLRLKFDAGTHSYWIPRQPPGPPPESLENQF